MVEVRDEIPAVDEFCDLRIAAGLSAMDRDAAAVALPAIADAHPAQQPSVPASATSVRAQCAGDALDEAGVGNSRRSIAASSRRRGESMGGRGGVSGAGLPSRPAST
jgi:hypothetical protein